MPSKKKGTKKQCWMCRGWQDIAYMVQMDFDGLNEWVCASCKAMIESREDQLEQKMIELEDMQEFSPGETIPYNKSENPNGVISEEAEKRKLQREKGDSDDEPAKETYLP